MPNCRVVAVASAGSIDVLNGFTHPIWRVDMWSKPIFIADGVRRKKLWTSLQLICPPQTHLWPVSAFVLAYSDPECNQDAMESLHLLAGPFDHDPNAVPVHTAYAFSWRMLSLQTGTTWSCPIYPKHVGDVMFAAVLISFIKMEPENFIFSISMHVPSANQYEAGILIQRSRKWSYAYIFSFRVHHYASMS